MLYERDIVYSHLKNITQKSAPTKCGLQQYSGVVANTEYHKELHFVNKKLYPGAKNFHAEVVVTI